MSIPRKWHGAHAEKQARNFGDEGTFGDNPIHGQNAGLQSEALLQLARALMERDLVTLIEVDDVREHAVFFLVGKPGNIHSD